MTRLCMSRRSSKQYSGCFTCSISFTLKKKTMKDVSTFPFYRWGNWGLEALMKLLVSEWDAFSWVYSCIRSKLCGKGNVYLDWWQKKKKKLDFNSIY